MRTTRTIHLSALLSAFACCSAAHAQIATDGTLGAATALTGPSYSIPHTLGQTFGPNLFHSFRDFNLAGGESATFGGPNSIANILARVTGGNSSNLNGRLAATIPGVNFFFINPSGVVFGPQAQVDVSGAFTVSTADFVRLQDGGIFHAQNPSASVLSSAPPAAFGFLNPQPAPIEIKGSTLQMKAGKSLALIGGDVRLKDGARLAVSEGGGIVVRGGNLSLRQASLASITNAAQGGGIDIALTGSLKISQGAAIVAASEGPGNSGHIVIQAGTVILDAGNNPDGATIATRTLAPTNGGASGDISVTSRSLHIVNGAVISTDTDGSGNGGGIDIQTTALRLRNGGEISADTDGAGLGGSVRVVADSVVIDGQGNSDVNGISAETTEPESGVGGSISITARTLKILNGGTVSTSTFGKNSGGNLRIKAGTILIDDQGGDGRTGVTSDTTLGGAGGTINVESDALQVINGGGISTDTDGPGGGGTITISTRALHLLSGGEISADTDGAGHGGSAVIEKADVIIINGQGHVEATGLSAGSKLGSGNGGEIQLRDVRILQVLNGGTITAFSTGSGNAGNITIRANDSIRLTGGSSILTSAPHPLADGGDISINAGRELHLHDSRINSFAGRDGGSIHLTVGDQVFLRASELNATAGGNGGNISIDPRFVVLDKSRLHADAINGNGGNITIRANMFLPSAESVISASSQFGVAGNIAVQSPNTNVGGSLVRLTTNPLTAESYLQERCLVQRRDQSSSFTVRRQIAAPSGVLAGGGN